MTLVLESVETFSHTTRTLGEREDDCLQQMQQDEEKAAAPVCGAAAPRVVTQRPPGTANTTSTGVKCFLLYFLIQLKLQHLANNSFEEFL